MNLWLDCEWNSYKGELISIALVDENDRYFYESLGCKNPHPWVEENVIPKIGRHFIEKNELQMLLEIFLSEYQSIHIIADWPEDIQHFCELLITGAGERINTPQLTMEVRRDINSDNSKIPHQALADAIALKEMHLSLAKETQEKVENLYDLVNKNKILTEGIKKEADYCQEWADRYQGEDRGKRHQERADRLMELIK